MRKAEVAYGSCDDSPILFQSLVCKRNQVLEGLQSELA